MLFYFLFIFLHIDIHTGNSAFDAISGISFADVFQQVKIYIPVIGALGPNTDRIFDGIFFITGKPDKRRGIIQSIVRSCNCLGQSFFPARITISTRRTGSEEKLVIFPPAISLFGTKISLLSTVMILVQSMEISFTVPSIPAAAI